MSQQVEKKVSVKPLGQRVLVQWLEQEETLKGGIILPETAREKQKIAHVIAVGKGKTTEKGTVLPMPVAVGDKVLVDKYAGQDVTIDDQDYAVVKADDIIAIVEA